MFNKLKQFKDLRDKAKDLQNTLSKESVTVEAVGGKIKLTMDGNLTLAKIFIDPELLSPSKKEKLEAGVKEAHADAMKKMQRIMAMKMKDMGGLPNIPGLN
ncbi:MAG: nucleoid-associated protein, YbaB/EbfC family [Candidatus Magasanikbacteria bacterium RIFCSPHIGHO2_01_FULL_41_23]|uniref:Nucleoid-associated protein A2983_01615 n=1 Tax=Candidatus Magasanikbacteria bacterium RIFCSPLOWO2_01_FULL_40_15 TaxID=1798686 RepID=A0A1F6N0H0_9BACT|nr:MAG: nucleoid-associated protein, YbaB/EbfC family [Candidatus Magasanikbacteria bacterium RIFCSPHIGHO2_01_FULL_41_23]OGH74669.1 MAG: nucleoid-associated protein, YbaB/EbfC family [Candidatus Magasanikbacteria bacterium RIFCSPHIGHO2_12_FULL_41_16]OGH77382.1 MAG: nucleoid-associated protein, YbaB/EbfC family [Candidatus Magasanikbacteria bacterium RIFCSPLOWO2_01_FULL_40_15]